jgi:hypothetical protein
MTGQGTVTGRTAEDLTVVEDGGTPVEGELAPTVAEIVPMHAAASLRQAARSSRRKVPARYPRTRSSGSPRSAG